MSLSNKSVVILVLLSMVGVLVQCDSSTNTQTVSATLGKDDVIKGQALAAAYCQSCHKLPDLLY